MITKRQRRTIWVMALLLFTYVVLWPTLVTMGLCATAAMALQGAYSVRLEKFSNSAVLASAEVSRIDAKLKAAFPLRLDAGTPGFPGSPFMPQHRIIASDSDGHATFAVSICFTHRQLQIAGGRVRPIPYAWRSPLRALFEHNRIPVFNQ